MMIQIYRDGDNILTEYNLVDIKDSGEVAHFITELEILKAELLDIWQELEQQ